MRATHCEFLTLRLPRDLRAALDGEARAAGVKVSVATRAALAVGLAAIRTRTSPDPRDPSPGAPDAPWASARVCSVGLVEREDSMVCLAVEAAEIYP